MAVMAGHQVQVYDHIKGHQYRQQYIDRIQVNAKGQGQDRAAKARHGLGGIGNQHNNRQPGQVIIHGTIQNIAVGFCQDRDLLIC